VISNARSDKINLVLCEAECISPADMYMFTLLMLRGDLSAIGVPMVWIIGDAKVSGSINCIDQLYGDLEWFLSSPMRVAIVSSNRGVRTALKQSVGRLFKGVLVCNSFSSP
jgi:hypothetical protein